MKQRRSYGRALRGSIVGAAVAISLGAGAGDAAWAQANEPRFVLSGIVIDGRGSARILLGEAQLTGGRSVLLRVGDTLGSYSVASIGTDHAVVQGPAGATIRIPLSGIAASAAPVLARSSEGTPSVPVGAIPQSQVPVQQPPPPTPEELERLMTPPPPGVYRSARDGVSAPVTGPPRWDVEDFKRQVQRHLIGLPH